MVYSRRVGCGAINDTLSCNRYLPARSFSTKPTGLSTAVTRRYCFTTTKPSLRVRRNSIDIRSSATVASQSFCSSLFRLSHHHPAASWPSRDAIATRKESGVVNPALTSATGTVLNSGRITSRGRRVALTSTVCSRPSDSPCGRRKTTGNSGQDSVEPIQR